MNAKLAAAAGHRRSTVLQETTLFSGSIADNLWYGRLDASGHDVVLAARAYRQLCSQLTDDGDAGALAVALG